MTTFYVGLWFKMYMLRLYEYILVFEQTLFSQLREMVLAPFRKWNAFINSRKDGKFGINLVDSKLITLRITEMTNVLRYLLSNENITIHSEAQIISNSQIVI